jgi:hypothetical protein
VAEFDPTIPIDPHEVIPPRAARRLTNWDFVGRGGPIDEMIKKVIEHTNTLIAPAMIDPHFYRAEDQQALQFHGRWGTFRVQFRIASHLLDRAYQGPAWLAMEMERLMSESINGALESLVREQMVSVVNRQIEGFVAEAQRKISDQKRDIMAEIDRRLERKPRWYHKLWKFLLRPVW